MSVQVGSVRMGRGLTRRVDKVSADLNRVDATSREPQTYAGSWE